MLKGELQKQRILAEAEARFCRFGYHETSIQDILTALNISKGAFYHHFPSKESVLIAICSEHAQQAEEQLRAQLETLSEPIDRLNAALSAVVPFGREENDFLAVVLPLMVSAEGRVFSDAYVNALTEAIAPTLDSVLNECEAAEVILPMPGASAAELLLTIVHHGWLNAAGQVVSFMNNPDSPEPRLVLDTLTLCREAVTRLLDAPYGSITLLDLTVWQNASVAIRHEHLIHTAHEN